MDNNPCICKNWSSTQKFITKHHPNCLHYNLETDAVELIENLLKDIKLRNPNKQTTDAFNIAATAIGRIDLIKTESGLQDKSFGKDTSELI